MPSLLPPAIMFAITVFVVTLILVPATFERKSSLLNFYWVGVWVFLAVIASVAGGSQTVQMVGLEAEPLAGRLQFAATLCFTLFVMFAWVRLSGVALLMGLRRITR